jgi:hypothetical protein
MINFGVIPAKAGIHMSAVNAFAPLKLIQAFIFLQLIALQVFCKQ